MSYSCLGIAKASSTYDTTIVPYARAWNRAFANQIQARLPRELRNMIYEWLWDDDTVDEYWDGIFLDSDEATSADHHSCDWEPPFWMEIPHFFLPSYVGLASAFELIETMYTNLPQSLVAQTPERIKDVLFNDLLHVGYIPIFKISALYVACKVCNYRTPKKCSKKNKRCEHSPKERAYVRQSELKACFDHLLAIPKKDGFELRVVFKQRDIRLAVLEEALQTFIEVHHTFIQAGAHVEVKWEYNWDEEVYINDLFDDNFSRDDFMGKMHGIWLDVSYTGTKVGDHSLRFHQEDRETQILQHHARWMNEPSNSLW